MLFIRAYGITRGLNTKSRRQWGHQWMLGDVYSYVGTGGHFSIAAPTELVKEETVKGRQRQYNKANVYHQPVCPESTAYRRTFESSIH